jgi:hypothetical protein
VLADTSTEVSAEARRSPVLVVDDNAVNLKVACAMPPGLPSQIALDGREAVEDGGAPMLPGISLAR